VRHPKNCLNIVSFLFVLGVACNSAAVPLPFSPYISDTVQICLNSTIGAGPLNIELFSSGISGKSLSCTLTIPYSSCPNEMYKRFLVNMAFAKSPWQEEPCVAAPTQSCTVLGPQSSLCASGWVAACSEKILPADLATAMTNAINDQCQWTNGMWATAILVPIFGTAALIAAGFGLAACLC
jgi:hypothetical protein